MSHSFCVLRVSGKDLIVRILETPATFPPLLGDDAIAPLTGANSSSTFVTRDGMRMRIFSDSGGREVLTASVANGATLIPLESARAPPSLHWHAPTDQTAALLSAVKRPFALHATERALPAADPASAGAQAPIDSDSDSDSSDSSDDESPAITVVIPGGPQEPPIAELSLTDVSNYIAFIHMEHNHCSTRKVKRLLKDIRLRNKGRLIKSIVLACHCRRARHHGSGVALSSSPPATARLQVISIDLIDMHASPSTSGHK